MAPLLTDVPCPSGRRHTSPHPLVRPPGPLVLRASAQRCGPATGQQVRRVGRAWAQRASRCQPVRAVRREHFYVDRQRRYAMREVTDVSQLWAAGQRGSHTTSSKGSFQQQRTTLGRITRGRTCRVAGRMPSTLPKAGAGAAMLLRWATLRAGATQRVICMAEVMADIVLTACCKGSGQGALSRMTGRRFRLRIPCPGAQHLQLLLKHSRSRYEFSAVAVYFVQLGPHLALVVSLHTMSIPVHWI